jgi:uncharacterized membrane protein YbhN (UPF0104 family)
MIYLICAILVLLLRAIFAAGIFYILSGKKAAWFNCLKLTVVAGALNKLFVSASGFIAGSYCSRFVGLPVGVVLGNFFIAELLSVSGWILLAIYFGARTVAIAPVYLVAGILCLLVLIYFQRARGLKLWRLLRDQTANMGRNIVWCGLYAGLDMFLFAFYYKVLFLYFKLDIAANKILEIIALSFSAGYLSPTPSGLGVKDAALVGLLMAQGVPGANAGLIAIVDRLIITGFWLAIGFFVSADLLKQAWINRKKVGRV